MKIEGYENSEYVYTHRKSGDMDQIFNLEIRLTDVDLERVEGITERILEGLISTGLYKKKVFAGWSDDGWRDEFKKYKRWGSRAR